jgi:hypothetical protein
MSHDKPLTILIGPATVRVKRNGSSTLTLATILGVDRDCMGHVSKIYLDRLVHTRADIAPEGWSLLGAITTILAPPSGFELPEKPVEGSPGNGIAPVGLYPTS